MITLNLKSGSSSSPIAVTQGNVTNSDCYLSNNTVYVKVPGYYEVEGVSTLTSSSATSTGMCVYANGDLIGNTSVFTASASGETNTVFLYTVVEIEEGTPGTYAAITLQPVGNPTVVSGLVSIKRIL